MKRKYWSAANWLAAVLGLAVLLVSCRTPGPSERALPSTIIRMKGAARYSIDGGTNWLTVRVGDIMKSGTLIQTAMGSYAEIVLGRRVGTKMYRRLSSTRSSTNIVPHVRILEDTILKLDQIRAVEVDCSNVRSLDIRLSLYNGLLMGSTDLNFPRSKYEVRFPDGRLKVREGGIYIVTADGIASAKTGAISLTKTNAERSVEIPSGFLYDARTEELTKLPTHMTCDSPLQPFFETDFIPPQNKTPSRRVFW